SAPPTQFNLCAIERGYSIETARRSLSQDYRCAAETHWRSLPLTPPPLHTRSLNAVPSTARAVATISAQRALDRTGVAAVRAARGQDEQGEFIMERLEAARQHAWAGGPR